MKHVLVYDSVLRLRTNSTKLASLTTLAYYWSLIYPSNLTSSVPRAFFHLPHQPGPAECAKRLNNGILCHFICSTVFRFVTSFVQTFVPRRLINHDVRSIRDSIATCPVQPRWTDPEMQHHRPRLSLLVRVSTGVPTQTCNNGAMYGRGKFPAPRNTQHRPSLSTDGWPLTVLYEFVSDRFSFTH